WASRIARAGKSERQGETSMLVGLKLEAGSQDSPLLLPASSSWLPARRSVVRVQRLVQFDRGFVGLALHGTAQRVATEQQVALAGQLARLDHLDQLALFVEQVHLGAGRDVQTGFDGIAVAQRDADTGIGADQAAFTDGNDDIAATGQRAHGGAAAAEVRALADEDARRDASFDHAGAFSAGVEVDEAFVHHRGAFADVGAQANARTVG